MAFDSVETPSGKVQSVLGGSVNYFSIAASFFAPVQVVAVVGEDYPLKELSWLKDRGIDVGGVRVAHGQTFHWVGDYRDNLNEAKTLSTFLNVFEHFDPRLSEEQKLSPYVFLGNIDPDLQHSVLDQVEAPRLVACDSMNFWITGKSESLRKLLKRIDILSINEKEALMLSGKDNVLSAADAILDMGPSVLVIKRGEYGAMLRTRSELFLASAYPLKKVVDPTGAGDSFAGAFMGFLASTGADRHMARQKPSTWEKLLKQAVFTGCVMASFTVEDFSFNRLRELDAFEFQERFKHLKTMTDVHPPENLDNILCRERSSLPA
jgi:sugar/nucleoside kinase (ribokinase family)